MIVGPHRQNRATGVMFSLLLAVLLCGCTQAFEKGGKSSLKFEGKHAFEGKSGMSDLGDPKLVDVAKPGLIPPDALQPNTPIKEEERKPDDDRMELDAEEEPMFSVQTEPPAFEQDYMPDAEPLDSLVTPSPTSLAPATASPQSPSPTSQAPTSPAPSTNSPSSTSPTAIPPTSTPTADAPGSYSDARNGERDETSADAPATSQNSYTNGTTLVGLCVLAGLFLFLVIVFVIRRRRNSGLNEKAIYDEIMDVDASPDRCSTQDSWDLIGKSYGTMDTDSAAQTIAMSPQYDAMPSVLPDGSYRGYGQKESTYVLGSDAHCAVMPELTSASEIVLAELDANGAALESRNSALQSGGDPSESDRDYTGNVATIATTSGSDVRSLRRRGRSPVKTGNDATIPPPTDTPLRHTVPAPPPRDYTPQASGSVPPGGTPRAVCCCGWPESGRRRSSVCTSYRWDAPMQVVPSQPQSQPCRCHIHTPLEPLPADPNPTCPCGTTGGKARRERRHRSWCWGYWQIPNDTTRVPHHQSDPTPPTRVHMTTSISMGTATMLQSRRHTSVFLETSRNDLCSWWQVPMATQNRVRHAECCHLDTFCSVWSFVAFPS
eukprot:m.207138 g.207138  ORF g.207138 m.207138 type:complete len:603 (+) comp18918_c0_seq3:151-1959(+)